MPFLVLTLGLLICFYAFTRYALNARPQEIKSLSANALGAVIAVCAILLAVTGRLGVGVTLLLILAPVWAKFFSSLLEGKRQPHAQASETPNAADNDVIDIPPSDISRVPGDDADKSEPPLK